MSILDTNYIFREKGNTNYFYLTVFFSSAFTNGLVYPSRRELCRNHCVCKVHPKEGLSNKVLQEIFGRFGAQREEHGVL